MSCSKCGFFRHVSNDKLFRVRHVDKYYEDLISIGSAPAIRTPSLNCKAARSIFSLCDNPNLERIYCFKELNRFCHCIVIQISFYENWLKYHLGVFQVLVWFAEHLALPSWYYNQPYLMIISSLWHASPNCFVNKVKVFHVKQKTIFCKLVLFVLSKMESESFAQ